MKRTLATLALVAGGLVTTSAAVDAASFTPPPAPRWQTRPCPTDYMNMTNCFWNHEQMGGTADFFVRKLPGRPMFCVFYSDPALAKIYDACYPTSD